MFIILGIGIQGQAVLYYLLNNSSEKIITVDVNPLPLSIVEKIDTNRVLHFSNGVKAFDWEIEAVKEKNVIVISCLPPQFNLDIMDNCIRHHWHMIDLGGNTEIVNKQFLKNATLSFK